MKLSDAVPLETRLTLLNQKLKTLEFEAESASESLRATLESETKQLAMQRQENRDLKATLASRRSAPPPLASSSSTKGQVGAERQVEALEKTVHNLRRQWDKVLTDKKTALSRLSNLQDNVKDLIKSQGNGPAKGGLTAGSIHRTSSGASSSSSSVTSARPSSALSYPAAPMMQGPAWREIRQLENRLEKAALKTNEAQSIRKTYESVIDRLKQEQVHYSAQGSAIEQEIKAMGVEYERLNHILREMHKGRDLAIKDLSAFEDKLSRERRQREEVIQGLKDQVKTLQQTNQALLQRQIPLADSALLPRGSNVDSISTDDEAIQALAHALVSKGKGDRAEDVDALVDELIKEQESCSKLKVMVAMAKMQLSDVEAELEELRALSADLKGEGGGRSIQELLDSAQEELKVANQEAEEARKAHDSKLRLHADVLSGVQHLASMVSSIPPGPGQMPSNFLVKLTSDPEHVAEVLSQCEERLAAAYQLVKGIPKAMMLMDEMVASNEW